MSCSTLWSLTRPTKYITSRCSNYAIEGFWTGRPYFVLNSSLHSEKAVWYLRINIAILFAVHFSLPQLSSLFPQTLCRSDKFHLLFMMAGYFYIIWSWFSSEITRLTYSFLLFVNHFLLLHWSIDHYHKSKERSNYQPPWCHKGIGCRGDSSWLQW